MTRNLQIEVRDSLAQITIDEWNALNDDGNPFLRHEFLYGLESTGCLGKNNGWFPRYFLLWSNTDAPRDLIGAVATYVKTNSYGEFVFDWAWAEAYERHQQDYYPKLVSSIPFTPATGRRLLVHPSYPYDDMATLLAAGVRQFCDSQKYSSLCAVTPEPLTTADMDDTGEDDGSEAQEPLTRQPTAERHTPGDLPGASDHLRRIDCQYHWHNRNYQSFDEFLAQCTSKRRKTIRRERRHVSDAGLRLEQRLGSSLSEREWQWVHRFYTSTFDRKWGNPSLTLKFFQRMGEVFGANVLIVFAYDDADESPEWPVACSIMFVGKHTLYGRFWGCRRDYNSLHFEACYYQGIEYCITHGIQHFEPGAQGEHKITRGFEPTITRSAHYIAHPGFRDAIANFLSEETTYVEQRCAGLSNLLPFKASAISL